MQYIKDLFTNRFILTALSSWAEAQVLKAMIFAIINKKFDISRLFGDGGMPSGHSATVTSLAVITGLTCGLGSFQFAMAFIFAIVVCHDAMGVRLETGKQAQVIKELQKSFEILTSKKLPEVKLKEFVGHTPMQVVAGVLLGIINGTGMYLAFFR